MFRKLVNNKKCNKLMALAQVNGVTPRCTKAENHVESEHEDTVNMVQWHESSLGYYEYVHIGGNVPKPYSRDNPMKEDEL